MSLTTAAAATLTLAGAARADYTSVPKDCSDDERLTRTYPIKDYGEALRHINADLDEYSDCRNVISRARLLVLSSTLAKPATGRSRGLAQQPALSPGGTSDSAQIDPVPDSSQKSPEQVLEMANPAQRAAVARLRAELPVISDGAPIVLRQQLGFAGDPGAVNRLPTSVLAVLVLLLAASSSAALVGVVRRLR